MSRQVVQVPGTPSIAPYSHAVWAGDLLYLSGQGALDPATGKLLVGDVGAQTVQCFQALFQVLEAAGLTPDNVVKVNVFLAHMEDFTAMNAVYTQQFQQPYPARTTIAVAGMPLNTQVEIEMIARR